MNPRDVIADMPVPKWLGTYTPPEPYRVFRLVAKREELADRIRSAKVDNDCTAQATPRTEIKMEQSIVRNRLEISLKEFKLATKVFTRKRLQMGPVLLAYEGGLPGQAESRCGCVAVPASSVSYVGETGRDSQKPSQPGKEARSRARR